MYWLRGAPLRRVGVGDGSIRFLCAFRMIAVRVGGLSWSVLHSLTYRHWVTNMLPL